MTKAHDTELPGFKLDVPPERVAKAVVRGVKRNKSDIIVAPLIMRALLRITAIAPRLGPPSPTAGAMVAAVEYAPVFAGCL
jgi:hypothetical protein